MAPIQVVKSLLIQSSLTLPNNSIKTSSSQASMITGLIFPQLSNIPSTVNPSATLNKNKHNQSSSNCSFTNTQRGSLNASLRIVRRMVKRQETTFLAKLGGERELFPCIYGLVVLGQRWQQERWQVLQLKWHSSISSEVMIMKNHYVFSW